MQVTGLTLPRTGAGVLAVMLLFGLGLMMPAPAVAHDEMTASTPKDGATLDEAPESIKLEFSGELQQIGSEVQVTTGAETVTVDEPVLEGRTITSALPDNMPAAKYTVVWRVVSSDGHPISGESTFTISGNDTEEPKPIPTKSEKNIATSNEPTAADATTDASDEPSDSGISPTLVVLLGLGFAAIIAIVTIILLRKMRNQPSNETQ